MMKWILAVAATLTFAASASAADKVVLMLNWYVYGEHAPFYYGKAKGIYAADGKYRSRNPGRPRVGGDHASGWRPKTADFGYVDVPHHDARRGKGRACGCHRRAAADQPDVGMGFVETNIKKPEDIKGKTVAITPADSMTQIWPLF